MRDEFLNETLFFGLDDARRRLATWVADYNNERPHSSLKYQTPAAYAAALTATGDRLPNPFPAKKVGAGHRLPITKQHSQTFPIGTEPFAIGCLPPLVNL